MDVWNVRRFLLVVWKPGLSRLFGLSRVFGLTKTNQMNQTDQIDQMNTIRRLVHRFPLCH